MAWRRPGDKPLSGPIMVSVLAHIRVTQPQWVNPSHRGMYRPIYISGSYTVLWLIQNLIFQRIATTTTMGETATDIAGKYKLKIDDADIPTFEHGMTQQQTIEFYDRITPHYEKVSISMCYSVAEWRLVYCAQCLWNMCTRFLSYLLVVPKYQWRNPDEYV